jgi:UDP-N-acetylglucosamine diphosphorylase/glucosamine-1-phosphate N-acetyltransferase
MPTDLPVILFDDGRGQLSPLTDLRPAFDVRIGALTMAERVRRTFASPLYVWAAPQHITLLRRETRVPGFGWIGDVKLDSRALHINGRCPLPPEDVWSLPPDHVLLERQSGDLIAAHISKPGDHCLAAMGDYTKFTSLYHDEHVLIARPWHVRKFRDACLACDLKLLTAGNSAALTTGVTAFGERGLVIAASARLFPSVVLDCESGPIVIADHAVIRPGAIISGPAYIGPHSTVLDRAVIRANTAIGPHCKVAGEVSGTVFQGYANKAHDGFLGDSWIGEWVNLGAGTTNSNLLNTYSEIICRAAPDGPNERTGETFLGAIIGDHVKTAICTRIMTGSILHTGSMFATTAPVSGTVSRFTWATDAGARTYRFDKFLDVARAAMARRKLEPSAAYIDRLRSLAEAGKQPV